MVRHPAAQARRRGHHPHAPCARRNATDANLRARNSGCCCSTRLKPRPTQPIEKATPDQGEPSDLKIRWRKTPDADFLWWVDGRDTPEFSAKFANWLAHQCRLHFVRIYFDNPVEVFNTIRRLKEAGITLLLVEQFAKSALEVADYAYVMERGSIAVEGSPVELKQNQRVIEAYLG